MTGVKHMYFVFFCVLIVLIVGCKKDTSENDTANCFFGATTEFTFPEETDKLVLYNLHFANVRAGPEAALLEAVEIFKRKYPDVEVEITNCGNDDYLNRMRTEIPAGRGPDLMFSYIDYLPDIEKTMSAQVFVDLNPYIANDDEFDMDNYIGRVAEAGQYDGHQYVLPFSQRFPILVTTQELLDETGIDPALFETFDGFIEACRIFHEYRPDMNFLVDTGIRDSDEHNLDYLTRYGGFHFIDYNRNEVTINRDNLLKMLDLCKLFYRGTPYQDDLRNNDSEYNEYKCLKTYDCLFTDTGGQRGTFILLNMLCKMEQHKLTPRIYMMPDTEDKHNSKLDVFAAIPNGAKNKLNAWRLLKILLSDDIQGKSSCMYVYGPVMKSALESFYDTAGDTKPQTPVQRNRERILELYRSIEFANVYPPMILEYVQKNLQPYLKGKSSFETCVDNLTRILEFYKDE